MSNILHRRRSLRYRTESEDTNTTSDIRSSSLPIGRYKKDEAHAKVSLKEMVKYESNLLCVGAMCFRSFLIFQQVISSYVIINQYFRQPSIEEEGEWHQTSTKVNLLFKMFSQLKYLCPRLTERKLLLAKQGWIQFIFLKGYFITPFYEKLNPILLFSGYLIWSRKLLTKMTLNKRLFENYSARMKIQI